MARNNKTPSKTTVALKKPGHRQRIGSAHADPAAPNRAPRPRVHKTQHLTNRASGTDGQNAPQTVQTIDARGCRHAIDQLERLLANAPGEGAKGIEDPEWQRCNANAIEQIRQKLLEVLVSTQGLLTNDATSRRPGLEVSLNKPTQTDNTQPARQNSRTRDTATHTTSKPSSPDLPLLSYSKPPPPAQAHIQNRKRSLSTTSTRSYPSEDSESDSDDATTGETVIDKSFRVDDRAAVLEYLRFRLLEFPGVLLKDVVSNWIKKVPEWKGFQKGGELQTAPKSWPEDVCFIGVHRLKKRDVVKLGAHVLTRFYYDEDAYDHWPEKLEKKIHPYLHDENAKFSSSTNPLTREENCHLVTKQIFPELWETLRTIDEYEVMRRQCESNGEAPPTGETITYHPYRTRKKKRPKSDRPTSTRQKKPAKQQKSRRQRGKEPKKPVAEVESFATALTQMMPPGNDAIDDNEYPPTEPGSPDTHMHDDELRAPSPSPTVASDEVVHTEAGTEHDPDTGRGDRNDANAYSTFAQRSFKTSFSCGPDIRDIPPMDNNVNAWTTANQFGLQAQFQEPEMHQHDQMQPFYSDATEYAQACPPANCSFSTVAYSENGADPQYFARVASVPVESFRNFSVHDLPRPPKYVPQEPTEPLNTFPGMFTNTTPASFPLYAVSNGFSDRGFYATASAPTMFPSAKPCQNPFEFPGNFTASTHRAYEPEHTT